MNEVLLKRFEKRTVKSASNCWDWIGTKNETGYGKIVVGWKENNQPVHRFAHRVSYELFVGLIPTGLEIDHLCRNHGCVNPNHLEAVTHKENVRRGILPEMMRKKMNEMTHCKRGHSFSGDNLLHQGENRKLRLCKTCRNKSKIDSYYKNRVEISIKRREKYAKSKKV
jgi:hypothetical protein